MIVGIYGGDMMVGVVNLSSGLPMWQITSRAVDCPPLPSYPPWMCPQSYRQPSLTTLHHHQWIFDLTTINERTSLRAGSLRVYRGKLRLARGGYIASISRGCVVHVLYPVGRMIGCVNIEYVTGMRGSVMAYYKSVVQL